MIPVLPVVLEPVLIDKGLIPFIAKLTTLPWISFCAGKCVTIQHPASGKKRAWKEPAVYDGNSKDYVSLLPNDKWEGGFGFWDFPKEVKIKKVAGFNLHSTSCALIVWYDITEVYPDDHNERTGEHVKMQVIESLRFVSSPGCRITLNGVTDVPAQVYAGFQLDESKMQHMTRPFGALRFEFDATFDEADLC